MWCREAFYKAKVKQQQRTLEELMDEKCKLLAIQDELQRLHETLPEAVSVSVFFLLVLVIQAARSRHYISVVFLLVMRILILLCLAIQV